MTVTALGTDLGARIDGIELAAGLDDAGFRAVEDACITRKCWRPCSIPCGERYFSRTRNIVKTRRSLSSRIDPQPSFRRYASRGAAKGDCACPSVELEKAAGGSRRYLPMAREQNGEGDGRRDHQADECVSDDRRR
jgi:hypothetical protein